ncbi:hypothetical protein M378DRAFT_400065 [Amanita muscaria Koide BX008]|uniref:Nephrocystin 3-like N-terminal domain-containing protein n=1 Tax=Amanita muscaria (strain Koide BX008) TaxID=946122 RepID=A0A0C2S3E8_AMAMK|nr:hypothetical protein M378DRAFT_400065 [Amanita muscaria Koide BX008]
MPPVLPLQNVHPQALSVRTTPTLVIPASQLFHRLPSVLHLNPLPYQFVYTILPILVLSLPLLHHLVYTILPSKIADVYEFMLEDGRLENLISMQDILAQASQVVFECAKFIQVYSQPNFLSRLGKGVFSDTDEAVAKYTNLIENLMEQFHALTNNNIRQNIRHALDDIRQLGMLSSMSDNIPTYVLARGQGDNQLPNRISYAEGAGLDTNKVCLDGTREEVLHEVINWIDDADPNAPRILWLFGTACTGKSAIAHTIARAMKESGALGSCFCFENGDVKRHTKLFSTISRDLAIGDVWLKQALASVIARDPLVATTPDVIQQWDHLIKEPLSAISGGIIGRLVIVIDALDENGDPPTMKHILYLLTKRASGLPRNVRILITSRPLPDICEAFDGAPHIKHMSMDEIAMSSTERDIQIYISNRLSDSDYSFSADEIVALAKRSDGLFGWAHLACNHIMLDTVWLSEHERYKKLMSQTESGGTMLLGGMYDVILKEIMGDRPEELVLSRFRSVMRHVLFTLEPLTLEALITMHQTVQPEHDKYDAEAAETILRSMGSLLAGIHDRSTPIRPLHYSFRDFLIDPDRSGQFFVDGDDADDGSSATRRYLESMTKILIGRADRLTKQPDFHGMDHFVPEFGNLINRNPEAIEDWEQTLGPLLKVLDKLLVPSNIDSLKDGYCQDCQFFQITRDTLTHFQTLRQREDPDVEQYLKSLEEIIRYGDAGNFNMNFGRVFSSAAIFGFMMAILAHQR